MAFIDLRRGERPQVLIAVAICFGIIAAHTMSETARDALFLQHLPASHLPIAFLVIGVASYALGKLMSPLTKRFGQRAALVATLLAGAGASLAFWASFASGRQWLFYAFYVWVGTFATTAIVEFWLFASQIFTVAQGKRVFGLIGTGAGVGTFVGAAASGAWGQRLPIEHMMLVVATVQALTAFLAFALPGPPPVTDARPRDVQEGLRMVWQKPYLLRVAALVLLSSLTMMLVDYQFKAAAASSVSPARLAPFFGWVYAALGAAALVVQFTAGKIVHRLGVAASLALMPALLLLGSIALPLVAVLGRALALRGVDGTLRDSLHRVGMELLYMPLSPRARERVKAFIDGGIGRTAQALGSLMLLGMAALGATQPLLGVCIAVGAAGWLVLAWTTRRPYLEVFLSTLDPSGIDTRARMPDLKGASLQVLVAALDSPDERLALSALDLLAAQGQERLVPRAILNHRSPKVLAKALEVLAASGRGDLDAALEPLLRHAAPSVRAAAVRARLRLGAPPELVRRFAADPDPVVRALAAVKLGDAGALAALAEGPPEVQVALLDTTDDAALAMHIGASVAPEVVRASARALGRIGDPRGIPFLISRLAFGAARHAVRQALLAFGDATLDALEEALEAPGTDLATRRHLPRTISCIHTRRAAAILTRNLLRQADGVVRFKILRGLGRLAAVDPLLVQDRAPVVEATLATARRLHLYQAWRAVLERGQAADERRATDCGRLLVTILVDKRRLGMERLFRLLAILHPRDKLADVYGAVVHDGRQARANAIEILDNLLPAKLRDWVIPLCDPDDEASAAHALRQLGPLPDGYDAVLIALQSSGDETLDAFTAHHRSELTATEPPRAAAQ